ncbi:hypothetical protein [Oceanobacillus timonensis]|uniref:hypothetical protein n=1 Tax=Oceanobacillus timonensis TaxID=1926285 RepID=UPI0009BA51A4|nr:hypothetical protein [Oceanobacillus timonensis]
MRKLVLFFTVLFLLVACNQQDETSNPNVSESDDTDEIVPGGIDAEIIPFNLENATEDADLIAQVTILEKVEEVSIEPVPYTVFRVDVTESIEGEPINETVTIKQLGDSEWSINNNEFFEPGEEYIFFLNETSESNSDYWIIGEETGFFQVLDDDTVVKLVNSIPELRDAESDNVNELNTSTEELKMATDEQVLDKQKLINLLNNLEGGN